MIRVTELQDVLVRNVVVPTIRDIYEIPADRRSWKLWWSRIRLRRWDMNTRFKIEHSQSDNRDSWYAVGVNDAKLGLTSYEKNINIAECQEAYRRGYMKGSWRW